MLHSFIFLQILSHSLAFFIGLPFVSLKSVAAISSIFKIRAATKASFVCIHTSHSLRNCAKASASACRLHLWYVPSTVRIPHGYWWASSGTWLQVHTIFSPCNIPASACLSPDIHLLSCPYSLFFFTFFFCSCFFGSLFVRISVYVRYG